MSGRLGRWSGLILLLLVSSAPGARAEQEVAVTHGMALDAVASRIASDLLATGAIPPGRPVVLTSPVTGDTMGLLTQRLMERLRAQGVAVRLAAPGIPDPDSASWSLGMGNPGETGRPVRLVLQVDGAGVTYVRRLRKFPFGTRGYERLASMRANATLLDPWTREVFWTRSAAHSGTDVVPDGSLVYAASGSGNLNPPIPRGGTRWLEPMIVVGVVAGLVVLFYSNRN